MAITTVIQQSRRVSQVNICRSLQWRFCKWDTSSDIQPTIPKHRKWWREPTVDEITCTELKQCKNSRHWYQQNVSWYSVQPDIIP